MSPETGEKRFVKKILPLLVALLLVPAGAVCYRAFRVSAGRAAGDFFYPYIKSLKMPVRFLSDRTLLLCSKAELAARVEHLSRLNSQLAVRVAGTGDLVRENERLRNLLKLKPAPGWRYMNAKVLLRDPLRWQEHMSIACGIKDGVHPGCAVIVTDQNAVPVLAGVISSVSNHTSVVTTVYNPLLKISGRIGGRATGFINGSGKRGSGRDVPIDFLPAETACVPGEAVMTTGYEHRIPAGIKIGELSEIIGRSQVIYDTPFKSGSVKLAFDPNLLNFVTVAVPGELKYGVDNL